MIDALRSLRSIPARTFVLAVVSLTLVGTAAAQSPSSDDANGWSWLTSIFEQAETTERADTRRRVPRGDEGRDRAERPAVVIDERRERDGRARGPRAEDRRGERTERRDDRTGRRDDRGRRDRRGDDRRDREAERDRNERRGRTAQRRSGPAGGPGQGRRGRGEPGPPFCRSGAGHPVHGMGWCRERGFAPRARPHRRYDRPRRDRRRDRRYERRRGLEGVLFGRREQRRAPQLTEAQLRDLLGRQVLDRVERLRRQVGLRGGLAGQWVDTNRGRVLRVTVGLQPFAELIDGNRDGRVDRAFVVDRTERR